LWSVGPSKGLSMIDSESNQLPVPKKWWYPFNERGVIVRLSDGRKSP
jgi:hypothetical protein